MLPTSRAEATQSLRAWPCAEHVTFVSSQSAEDGGTISKTRRIWRFARCEGAIESDEDSVVLGDTDAGGAAPSAPLHAEARTRTAIHHCSR
jgi:hypothetical protein